MEGKEVRVVLVRKGLSTGEKRGLVDHRNGCGTTPSLDARSVSPLRRRRDHVGVGICKYVGKGPGSRCPRGPWSFPESVGFRSRKPETQKSVFVGGAVRTPKG